MADGVEIGAGGEVLIVNDTDLPTQEVERAVMDAWAESASLGGVAMSSFGSYSINGQSGSLLTRSKYQAPTSISDEICLARDMAERDDSVAATFGMLTAIAFGEGMANLHRDEATVNYFNEIAKEINLDATLKELYREYLIAGSLTTVQMFTSKSLSFTPRGFGRTRTRPVVLPRIAILPAEQIRVRGDGKPDGPDLIYVPKSAEQERWLAEFFDPTVSPARKAELRRERPVWAAIFTGRQSVSEDDDGLDLGGLTYGYGLNPRMVQRTVMPKGAHTYPRPPLTADFALLEAKRLLAIMDHALLQGGTNYIVIARKGTDQRPAVPAEIQNLTQVVKQASRTGVMVGDHRLSLDIVTPDLTELLNPAKRSLLDRKIAMRLMRLPEHATLDPGVEGQRADMEILARVVTSDRRDIKRHVEAIYDDVVERNPALFTDAPNLWFPKIVLTGQDAFNQQVLKLRDRGDIPRKWAVEAAGFDYEASVEQRRREIEAGDDKVLIPAEVPFSPSADNSDGRPPGSSGANGAPNSQPTKRQTETLPNPRQQLQRSKGEPVAAWYDEDERQTHRVGELTYGVLESYRDASTIGRLTAFERKALEDGDGSTRQEGPLIVVPVNPGYAADEFQAIRLEGGVSMLIGRRRDDGAVIAKAICFRDTAHSIAEAENRVVGWGFPVKPATPVEAVRDPVSANDSPKIADSPAPPPLTLIVNAADGRTMRRRVVRDDDGQIIGSVEEPVDVDE